MKIEIKEIYKCEYCNKPYQRKHACIRHEKVCFHNPDNDRPCFNCIDLTKKNAIIYKDTYCKEIKEKVSVFFCRNHKKYLYTPLNEHKCNFYDLVEESNNPMPLKCKEQSRWSDNQTKHKHT